MLASKKVASLPAKRQRLGTTVVASIREEIVSCEFAWGSRSSRGRWRTEMELLGDFATESLEDWFALKPSLGIDSKS
jgi:hypothetical protein